MHKFLSLLLCSVSAAVMASETLHLEFTAPKELPLGGAVQKIQGEFVDGKYLKIGKNSLHFPGNVLVGSNSGTILFGFKLDALQPPLSGQRTIVHLRTASRLTIAFNFYPSGNNFQFTFSDRAKTFNHEFGKIEIGRDYQFGVTWDGKVIRLYMDGRMVAEGKQPLDVKARVRDLNIGPYKDGWMAPKPWADDTLMRYLYVYDNALTPQEIAKLTDVTFTPLAQSHPAQLSVPPVPAGKSSPVIDGKLNEEAWRYAASMPRLICSEFPLKSGALPPHKFMLTYDKENLYLGFNSLFPGRTPLQEGAQRTPDKEPEVWGTESFEFYLYVNGRRYRFAGNVAGGYTEWLDRNSRWYEPWQYAVSQEVKIDDSVLWQGEVAIPWKTLGLSAAPAELRFNFCRTWRLPEVGCSSSLALSNSYGAEKDVIPVRFTETPTVQITRQNDPAGGEYVQEFSIASAKRAKVTYTVALAKQDGSVSPMPLHTQTCILKPGEKFTDRSATKIATPGYDCLLYTGTADGKVFMQEFVPFKLNEEYFTVTPLLLQGKVLVELKQGLIRGKFGDDFKGKIRLADRSGKMLFSAAADGETMTVPFDRDYPAGSYNLELCDASGKAVYQKVVNYPGRGEWETMDFHKEWILPPYTPIVSKAGDNALDVSVVGRTYTWQKSLLPSQIVGEGEKLFFAPAAVLIDGKMVDTSAFRTTDAKNHRVEFKADGKAGDSSVAVDGWIEYDGVQWNKLTVIPGKDAQKLSLRFELPARFAKYLHAVTPSNNWGSKTTRAVPEGKIDLGYHIVVWLGNEEKGFCFFTETRYNWTTPANRSYSIEKNGEKAVLTVNIADKMVAGKPYTVEFGTLASPVKPLPANYPFNTYGWTWCAAMNRPGKRPTIDACQMVGVRDGDLGSFFGDQDTPAGRMTANSHRRILDEMCKGHNVRPVPYNCGRYLSIRYPETAAYLNEWTLKPEIAMDYQHTGHFVYDCCPTTTAANFFAYRALKMLQRNPEMKGLYFDFGLVSECSNANHGCHQRVPLLGLREFYRKMVVIQLMAGIKEPLIVIHNTDCIQLPANTFVSNLLNGENVRQSSSSLLHNKRVLTDTYDLAMFACELSSLPFGITNSDYLPVDNLLKQYGGGDETDHGYKFRQGKASFAAILPHHTIPDMARNHHGLFDKVLRTYDRFGVDKAKFIGYWRKPLIVTKGEDILASCFVSQDKTRVLAVIGHIGKKHQDQQLTLSLDLAQLGLAGKLTKAVDTMTAPDPDYDLLFELQKKGHVPPVRAPIRLDGCDFGSKVTGFDGKTLQMELKNHSFAIVELMP